MLENTRERREKMLAIVDAQVRKAMVVCTGGDSATVICTGGDSAMEPPNIAAMERVRAKRERTDIVALLRGTEIQ